VVARWEGVSLKHHASDVLEVEAIG
jgi:hypothetical protein